jgi:calcineurin-like phosphoesterase family protein
MANFFISDTHFFHRRILEYSKARSHFTDEIEMNETLIASWNSVVSNNDYIYHLGDFAFANIEKSLSVLERLRGRKILVKGNHDKKLLKSSEFRSQFFEIHNSYHEIQIDGIFVIMCHYPIASWNGKFHDSFHLHGHTHGTLQQKGKSLDVGIDNRNDFKPWSWEEICTFMKSRTTETTEF